MLQILTISNPYHIWILILIILSTGLIGGLTNYFLNNISKIPNKYELIKSLLLGLVAASSIPLFLNTLGSKLLIIVDKEKYEESNYLIFAGFCLIAGVFSTKFLQSLSDKIFKEIEEVKKENADNKEKIDAVVNHTSDDIQPTIPSQIDFNSSEIQDLDKVVNALKHSKYTFRTINGIMKESNINQDTINEKLVELAKKDLVKPIIRSDGKKLWTLTSKGRLSDF